MHGIVGYGSYVPRFRIKADTIAHQWGADAEAFKQLLLSGEATAITYSGEQSAELMAEDAEIAAFPIPLEDVDITIMDISEVFETGR